MNTPYKQWHEALRGIVCDSTETAKLRDVDLPVPVDGKESDTHLCILMGIRCVLKNDNAVAHCNFIAHQPILVILAEMLPREYAIEWWVVIPPFLTNVSALPAGNAERQKLYLFSRVQD